MIRLKYLAADVRRFYIQLHIVVVETLLGHLLQLIKSIFPVTRFVPSGLWHTAHPLKFSAIQIIGAFYLYRLCFDAFFALFQIIAVITFVLVYPAVVYFDNLRANTIKEIPVVRYHQQSKVGTAQIVFQPFGHIKVKMVGRLIQYQQIRLGDKRIGKRHALQLSAGKRLYLLVEITNFQLGKDLLGLLFVLPGLLLIHTHQNFVQTGVPLRLHAAFVLLNQFYGAVAMMKTSFENGQFLRILRILFQISDSYIASERNCATIITFLSGKNVQQCGLAAAIFSNEAHTLPFG